MASQNDYNEFRTSYTNKDVDVINQNQLI